jgi:hypothetical protein
MFDLGLSLVCGLWILSAIAVEEINTGNILDHFVIDVIPLEECPDLANKARQSPQDSLVVQIACDKPGDDNDNVSPPNYFHCRPDYDEESLITFIVAKPKKGALHVGIGKRKKVAFVVFEGL